MTQPTFKQLYERQITLKEVGENGQQALQKSTVVIVGCGGLGSMVAVKLAASGVGTIHLVDFDIVSVSNLHRQVFYTLDDVEKSKVTCLKNYITKITPFVNVIEHPLVVTKNNIQDVLQHAELIVDCTDNLHIKYLINDACVLSNKTLVYGSLHKFDGYIATFNHEIENGKRTANLRDAFPDIPAKLPPTCAEAGTLNTIVGIIALYQANEVLKIILKKGDLFTDKIFIYNSLYNTFQTIQLQKKIITSEIKVAFEKEDYNLKSCNNNLEINSLSLTDFWEKLKKDNIIVLSFGGKLPNNRYNDKVIRLPYLSFNPYKIPIKYTHEYILVCEKGTLSYDAGLALKEAHPNLTVFNLTDGLQTLTNLF